MADRPTPGTGSPSAASNGAAAGDGAFGAVKRLAMLFALTGFAIAQPVLDVTGRAPDFFLYRRANTNEMRLFVALVVLLPPLTLWLIELVVGVVSKAAARAVHLAFCAGLFAVLLVQLGKKAGLFTGIPLGVLAAAAGIGLAVLLARTAGFRQAVLYATPAPLIFALLFVLTSPSGALVRGSDVRRTSTNAAGSGTGVATRPPVVFLFLDEFPLRAILDGEGRIDAERFPNFARLQKLSNWYPNATGVTGWTPFAAPAMLRGRYPEKAVAASYIEYPENIFTLLAGSYEMRAYETIGEMCPPGLCIGVAAGREVGMRALSRDTIKLTTELVSPYRAKSNPTEQFVENAVEGAKEAAKGKPKPGAMDKFDRVAENQPERFGPYLRDLQPMARPNLHFMHLLLPHSPYRYLPSGKVYQRTPVEWPEQYPEGKAPQTTSPDKLWSMVQKQRTVLQTAYLDNLLGQMLDRMKATGLLDQSLLIVTADHGTGIDPGERYRQLDDTNAPDIAWVPLFVKAPGQQEGKVDRRNAMHVDLLPTIADVLNIRIPWRVDGQSLLGPERQDQVKRWYDSPGTEETIDTAKWAAEVKQGWADQLGAKPGRKGLFAVGPHAGLVGKKVSELTVGAPSPVTADLHQLMPKLDDVDPEGLLPASVFGTLDRGVGEGSTWLVASLNGTIAGTVAAMDLPSGWRFTGMLDDSLFTKGRADVALYEVRGSTLHRLNLVP